MSSSKVWAIKIWYAEFVFVFCFVLSICFGFPFLKIHSRFIMKHSPNLGSIQYQLNVF